VDAIRSRRNGKIAIFSAMNSPVGMGDKRTARRCRTPNASHSLRGDMIKKLAILSCALIMSCGRTPVEHIFSSRDYSGRPLH
jgi:hypothetical protein